MASLSTNGNGGRDNPARGSWLRYECRNESHHEIHRYECREGGRDVKNV